MNPPTTGPSVKPMAETRPPDRPMARPRSGPVKREAVRAKVLVIIKAAPMACPTRQAINCAGPWATPASIEATP